MGGTPAENGKCPEGYEHVFGPLCVEKTTLAKAPNLLPALPTAQAFSSAPCEAALSALRSVTDKVEELTKLPRQLMRMARRLMDYPFDRARELMDGALGAMDEVSAAIDALLGGPLSDLAAFRRALEKAMECPFLVDTPVGALMAEILDTLNKGGDIRNLANRLKQAMSALAADALDQLKETPAEALSNVAKLFDDVLERSGLKELLDLLEGLELCVESLCEMGDVFNRLPKSASEIKASLNASVDNATGKLKGAVARPATAAQETAARVAADYRSARAKVALRP